MTKQGEVFVQEALSVQDVEDRSVVHSIECMLDVEVLLTGFPSICAVLLVWSAVIQVDA
jgi:hypothetical protein